MLTRKARFSTFLLIFLSILLLVTSPVNAAQSFTDLGTVKWAEKEINYLFEKNIINGYGNGKFGPNDLITREQAAQILVNALTRIK